MRKMQSLLLVLVCLPLFCHAVDQTLQQYARGEDVVDAVVEKIRSKCLLVDDKYLMRRIAAVDTDFGNNAGPRTGGIWKVTASMIRDVNSICSGQGRVICNGILQSLSFDLTTATMSEMDTPLYSGLVMHTYISFKSTVIPASVSAQAIFWAKYIRSGGNTNLFVSKSSIKVSCSAVEMELVFAIDASGSVGSSNFQKTLEFLEKVVKQLQIASDMTRVAVIRYASSSSIAFNLGVHSSVTTMVSAIRNIRYTGGGTGTAAAIKLAQNSVFSNARSNVPKVFVLITDGYSNNRASTILAASQLKNDSTTIFTIGIGSINPYEMLAVASPPACTHFYSLSSYNEITAIISEIQREACEVPTEIDMTSAETSNSSNSSVIADVPIPTDNSTKTQNIIVNVNGTSTNNSTQNMTKIKVEVVCGTVNIFASNTFNKPSAAYHTFKAVATDGTAGWIRSPISKKLYLSLVSQKRFDLAVIGCTKPHYNISFNPPEEGVQIICRENGVDRECTSSDIKISFGPLCNDDGVPNPCTEENILKNTLRFKHPKASNKYIQCKITGDMEIVTCPKGTQYNEAHAVCGPYITKAPGNSTLYTGKNPCTVTAIRNRQFYFANPSDKSSFVQCNEWGTAFLVKCPTALVWSQQAKTCVQTSSVISTNPCKSTPRMFYHKNPTDRKSFIQCDAIGNAFLISCPTGTVWSQANLVCVHDSIKLGLIANSPTTVLPTFTTQPTPCIHGRFYPHSNRSKYYQCVWGSLTEMPCPGGLIWVQKISRCDFAAGSNSP